MLGDLGLSQQDEDVYRVMLEHPQFGVADLAAHLGIPPEAIRATLDNLADLALVMATAAGPRAVSPQAGLMSLLARAEAEVASRQRQVEATRVAIATITSTYAYRRDEPESVRLDGIDVVRARLAQLARETKRECLSFTTGGAQHPETIAAEKPLNQLALERGISIRNIYQESFRNDPATLAHARWMAELGSHSRTVPMLPMRMVITDQEVALVPIDPANPLLGALELRSPGVVVGLVALFEQMWTSGTPFGGPALHDDHGLAPLERDLLRLLAAGHTDETAARKLAVSVRSVQRMMTVLTKRLNAASRFQAGVEANRRGWV